MIAFLASWMQKNKVDVYQSSNAGLSFESPKRQRLCQFPMPKLVVLTKRSRPRWRSPSETSTCQRQLVGMRRLLQNVFRGTVVRAQKGIRGLEYRSLLSRWRMVPHGSRNRDQLLLPKSPLLGWAKALKRPELFKIIYEKLRSFKVNKKIAYQFKRYNSAPESTLRIAAFLESSSPQSNFVFPFFLIAVVIFWAATATTKTRMATTIKSFPTSYIHWLQSTEYIGPEFLSCFERTTNKSPSNDSKGPFL